jgi:periplasmic protein TonB
MLATDPLEPRSARMWRWAGAAVFVAAAHIGCTALAMRHWQDDEADDGAAGPVVIEMVMAPAAKPMDTPDVAHGPLTEEAKVTPPAAKATPEKVEEETPRVDASPAPEPEVVLPQPRPAPEQKPEDPQKVEKEQQQRSADLATPAPLTMAPPRVEATETPAAFAPAPGASAAAARVRATWEKALVSHLNRFKRYPDAARAKGSQGDVIVTFTIDRTGLVLARRVVRTSGSSSLDEEALSVLQRASPLPAPPGQVGGATFDLSLPIQFRIK